jgi:hypothetical protein
MSMRAVHSCYVSIILLLAIACTHADDAPPTLSNAVRKAIAERQLQDSDNLGDRSAKLAFREVAGDGGVLVGLEVSLSKWGEREIPYTIRPIYRAGNREWTGGLAGSPGAKEVRRTVRTVAKPGYAVGGMWVRSGGALDRICLLFMRIEDGHLDRADGYPGEWVGTSDGGSEKYLDGRGRPVVGLFADASRDQARNFGFIYAKVDVPAPKPKEPDPIVAVPAPQPLEQNDVTAEGRSNLALEAAARKQEREAAGSSGPLILLALLGIVGLPLALIGYFVLGQKEPAKARKKAEEDGRPRKSKLSVQSIEERPELARRLQPYMPSMAPKGKRPEDSTLVPGCELPPFFMARATYRARFQRMTRVYVLPNELLIIDAGPGADQNVTAGVAANVFSGGGVLSAFIGGAVGTMVADDQKARGQVLQKRLDGLYLPALLQWATEEGNFRAKFEDLIGLSIDPPGDAVGWRERSRTVGTFRFRHLRRGEYMFELLCPAELRGAAELLRRAVGANLHLSSDWDEATAGYLTGL